MEIPELGNELIEIKKIKINKHKNSVDGFKNRLKKVEQINEMEDKAKEHLILIPKSSRVDKKWFLLT